jgi:hypothetical protein
MNRASSVSALPVGAEPAGGAIARGLLRIQSRMEAPTSRVHSAGPQSGVGKWPSGETSEDCTSTVDDVTSIGEPPRTSNRTDISAWGRLLPAREAA